MNGEQTRFKNGDKAAEKYTKEVGVKIFKELIDRAKNNNWYSVQEIVLENSDLVPYSSFYYLMEKFPFLDKYKKILQDIVVSKVNRGAILGTMNATACIWRMKQLGETDRQEIEQTNHNITVEI